MEEGDNDNDSIPPLIDKWNRSSSIDNWNNSMDLDKSISSSLSMSMSLSTDHNYLNDSEVKKCDGEDNHLKHLVEQNSSSFITATAPTTTITKANWSSFQSLSSSSLPTVLPSSSVKRSEQDGEEKKSNVIPVESNNVTKKVSITSPPRVPKRPPTLMKKRPSLSIRIDNEQYCPPALDLPLHFINASDKEIPFECNKQNSKIRPTSIPPSLANSFTIAPRGVDNKLGLSPCKKNAMNFFHNNESEVTTIGYERNQDKIHVNHMTRDPNNETTPALTNVNNNQSTNLQNNEPMNQPINLSICQSP